MGKLLIAYIKLTSPEVSLSYSIRQFSDMHIFVERKCIVAAIKSYTADVALLLLPAVKSPRDRV